MPKIHRMRLNPAAFQNMKAGRKTVELRLYDAKRKKIRLGDTIIFIHNEDRHKKLRTRVTALLIYPTFDALIADLPAQMTGFPSKRKALQAVNAIYTARERRSFFALGLKISLISS